MSQSIVVKKKVARRRFPLYVQVKLLAPFQTGDKKRSYPQGAEGSVIDAPSRGFRSVEMVTDGGEIYVPISQLAEVV